MPGMTDWLSSPSVVDLVLAVVVLEAAWLIGARRMPRVEVTLCLLPGFILLLALRGALAGVEAGWIAMLLAASFPVHLADLARRRDLWTRRRTTPPTI